MTCLHRNLTGLEGRHYFWLPKTKLDCYPSQCPQLSGATFLRITGVTILLQLRHCLVFNQLHGWGRVECRNRRAVPTDFGAWCQNFSPGPLHNYYVEKAWKRNVTRTKCRRLLCVLTKLFTNSLIKWSRATGDFQFLIKQIAFKFN
jgi:hypothetical protein